MDGFNQESDEIRFILLKVADDTGVTKTDPHP